MLFDLSTLRRLAADETVRAMYSLPRGMDLDPYSHVVLTSRGTLVALRDEPKLLDPTDETVYAAGQTEASLYRRFSDRFDRFPGDDVDCLGFGETPPFPPVLLHLQSRKRLRRSERPLRRRTLRATLRTTQGDRGRVPGRKSGRTVLRRPFPKPSAHPHTRRGVGPVQPHEPLQPVLLAARFDR